MREIQEVQSRVAEWLNSPPIAELDRIAKKMNRAIRYKKRSHQLLSTGGDRVRKAESFKDIMAKNKIAIVS